jgi:signal recognition particle subunit SRP54
MFRFAILSENHSFKIKLKINMFENLSQSLNAIFNKIKGKSHITEADIDVAMREIRISLLEADVALSVIKTLTAKVKEKALGSEVIKSVMPGQMIVKIIHNEITTILGAVADENDASKDSDDNNIDISKSLDFIKKMSDKAPTANINLMGPIAVIMLVGLQGSGKTTTAAKLALLLRKRYKKNPLLASTDIYRPAAQLQLESLAKQVNVSCLEIVQDQLPLDITKRAFDTAKSAGHDVLIIDTAGRLQTDDALMLELQQIHGITNPREVILVSDAMLGQESINIAQAFNQKLDITGIILTRIDGDTRGGAALSMKFVTGKPIKFVGIGEKISDFEEFHPERVASRILGMGDVVSLVERAADVIEAKEAEKLQKKIEQGKLDMHDILSQLKNLKKIGSVSSILSMIPGLGKMKEKLGDAVSDKMLKKQEAIIQSMTNKERSDPKIINSSRKKRIAKGSGSHVSDVNILLKRYSDMQLMMKKMGKMDQNKIQNMLKIFQ